MPKRAAERPERAAAGALRLRGRPGGYIPPAAWASGRGGDGHAFRGDHLHARLTASIFALLLALARPLAAQDDRWQVTLDGDHYVWDIRVGLDGATCSSSASPIAWSGAPVAHISEIRLIRKSDVEITGGGAIPPAP